MARSSSSETEQAFTIRAISRAKGAQPIALDLQSKKGVIPDKRENQLTKFETSLSELFSKTLQRYTLLSKNIITIVTEIIRQERVSDPEVGSVYDTAELLFSTPVTDTVSHLQQPPCSESLEGCPPHSPGGGMGAVEKLGEAWTRRPDNGNGDPLRTQKRLEREK